MQSVFSLVGEVNRHYEKRWPPYVDSSRAQGLFLPSHFPTVGPCRHGVVSWCRQDAGSIPRAEPTLDMLVSFVISALLWLTDGTWASLPFGSKSCALALFLWLTRKRTWNQCLCSYRKWMCKTQWDFPISGAPQPLEVPEWRQERQASNDALLSQIISRSWSFLEKDLQAWGTPQPGSPSPYLPLSCPK